MQRRGSYLLACLALALASGARAGETITYRYDELGRLTRVSRSTAGSTAVADYRYDSADNRTNVTVTTGGTPPVSSPPPTEPPPQPTEPPPSTSGNRPPVAVADAAQIMKCAYQGRYSVLENDHDPEGNVPLTLVGISYSSHLGTASNDGPRGIMFLPNGNGPGTVTITYTVADSLGATATGTFTLDVVQGQCE